MANKIHEFIAHSSPVVQCRIGQQSRIMASCGDSKVFVWAIGKTTPILTLQHNNNVDSVGLDWQEEIIVAGSQEGSIKLWDLETSKVIRSLNGHKSSVNNLQFHPYGDFFASTGDKQVKIWDIRRKGCIQTYQADNGIHKLNITPDGRWVCSGSDNGTVMLWDMTAGKLIHSSNPHLMPISSIEFSPAELVMVTTSNDGKLNIVDLQSFDNVLLPLSDCPAQPWLTVFHPSGTHLLVLLKNGLSTWSLDCLERVDTLKTNWTCIQDAKVLEDEDKLLFVGSEQNFINIWGMNMNQLQAFKKEESVIEELVHEVSVKTPMPSKSTEAKLIIDTSEPIYLTKPSSIKSEANPTNDEQVLDLLFARHSYIVSILKNRLTNIRTVRQAWDEGMNANATRGVKDCFDALIQIKDPAVCIDVLRIVNLRPKLFSNLDLCAILLPILGELVFEAYDDYIVTVCNTVRILLKNFGSLIVSTIKSSNSFSSPGIDLTREERIRKCKVCLQQFKNLTRALEDLQTSPGYVGVSVREVLKELVVFQEFQ